MKTPIGAVVAVLLSLVLAACTLPEPPPPATPRATAATVLEITPAPTLDIDATATTFAALLVPTPTPAGLYIVQAGDTLSDLAVEFGTTVAEIMAANGLTDPNALQVGQPLIIPSLIDTSPSLGGTPEGGLPELTPQPTPAGSPTPTAGTP